MSTEDGRPVRAERPLDGAESPGSILDDWYSNHYSDVAATADGSFFERFMHRSMEHRYGAGAQFTRVLEVGGNKGEHVPYVRHSFDEYLLTDLRPPTVKDAVAADPRVAVGECDVTKMPYEAASFDRVVSTCVLHHVDTPLGAASEIRRVLRPGGVATILIPTDPGLAFRVAKALTSGRAAKKRGIQQMYNVAWALDHRNHFRAIYTQLRYVFRNDDVVVDWFPFKVPSVDINAFVVVNARVTQAR
jgi:phosphatidylethanolamine/phosphatidyl-N-methylethanolamine N-methyltransferase